MKKASSQKNKNEQPTIEGGQPKRKRGRPPKAKNVEVLPPPPPLPPAGVGVFMLKDGHTYFSTTRETIRVSSQPTGSVSDMSSAAKAKPSSSQP